ncbi:UNVERIFIED_CONTAM: hypothetical protein GTU68_021871 [Idotea baltica]|nr:hypothetical protein [Idotea baltica]
MHVVKSTALLNKQSSKQVQLTHTRDQQNQKKSISFTVELPPIKPGAPHMACATHRYHQGLKNADIIFNRTRNWLIWQFMTKQDSLLL